MTKLGTLIAAAAAAFLLAACAPQYEAEAPIVGWTCMPGFGGCDGYGGHYTPPPATVGLPFKWEMYLGCNAVYKGVSGIEIQTGRLPPGLEIELTDVWRIVGVPTRAGSFSFQVLFQSIYCTSDANHPNYVDWSGQYTIVVTGS